MRTPSTSHDTLTATKAKPALLPKAFELLGEAREMPRAELSSWLADLSKDSAQLSQLLDEPLAAQAHLTV